MGVKFIFVSIYKCLQFNRVKLRTIFPCEEIMRLYQKNFLMLNGFENEHISVSLLTVFF